MDAPVESFCTGRFKHLKEFIGPDAIVRDWARMEAMEVANLVPDAHRMMTAILHRNLEAQGVFEQPEKQLRNGQTLKALHWARQVSSKMLRGFGRTLDAAIDHLLAGKTDANDIDIVDLRFCNLMDEDVEDLTRLCALVQSKRHPDQTPPMMINIRGNRFCPDAIESLSDMCEYAFVYAPDFGANRMTRDELEKLSDERLKRFIFAYKNQHLNVPTEKKEMLQKAYAEFYEAYEPLQ